MAALAASCAVFVVVDQAFNQWVSARYAPVDRSVWEATRYGVLSRLHVVVPLLVLVAWRPRLMGFRIGDTLRRWRLVLVCLLANCGVVAAYLFLTGGTTPYSADEWLLTEVVTVPLVEETMWRGAVFAVLLSAFRRLHGERAATALTVWWGGLAFGLLHAANALVGVPVPFVAVQVANAAVWGIVYGHVRARTGSIVPPLVLHAAMSLVVASF